ncbi:hypothetical protein AHAS_Ahas16G0102800 [Arachis hypogaea]
MQWQGNSLTLVHFMRPTLRKLVALCREDCGSVNVKQMCKEIDEMGISSFMATNSRDGYHKGDARCDPGNQTDDSAEFDVMNEDSDEEASGYGDVLGLTAENINRMKGDYGKDENGNLIRRRFFCNWAGLRDEKHYARLDRKRMHKPETRTNCEAKLSIYLDRGTSNWKVRKVILDHNHDLTPIGMVHLMLQFCGLSDATKAHMESMHSYGLPTSKIVGYMSGIAGGYSLLGFTKKDAYNHLDKKKRGNVADGDTNATVVYLQGKAAADPMSMVRYNVTNEGMLANLFWEDGASRAEFQHFGDVVAFDSTYRKNKYRRLLVIFSGTNNHRQTTIFGFGLLLDETTASYMWVLENLLEVMCNRMPSVVVTNGDDAFIAAVR